MSIYSHHDTPKMQKPKDGDRRKGWATPYGYVDFKEPVTYSEALEVSKTVNEAFQAAIEKEVDPLA